MKKHLKYFLPFYLGLLFFLILLNSCITEKKRAKICKTCTIKIKDSIHEVVTVTPFDTTLFLSGIKSNPIEVANCDSLMKLLAKNNNTVTLKEKGIKPIIIKTPTGLKFYCESDSLKKVITLLKSTKQKTRVYYEQVESKCKLEHLSWWDNFWIKLGRFETLIILFFIGFKAFKYYHKFHLP